eukprot:g3467.t1
MDAKKIDDDDGAMETKGVTNVRELKPSDTDDMWRKHLPDPGHGVYVNYGTAAKNASSPKQKTIRVLSWNIERGIKIEKIIQELKSLDADILLLSEVDVYTGRCGTSCNPDCAKRDEKRRKLNCGKKIAEALSMSSMLLVTEMKLLGGGIMANAI